MYALLILLASLTSFVNGVGFHGFTYEGLEEPVTFDNIHDKNIHEKWITQPLDHFNPRDNRTWSMRYYENTAFFNKTGPILIELGGEWEIATGFLKSGLMYDVGSAHGAMLYYTEHRYYGRSKPTEDTSEENLQYLNIDQALADVAYFIETKKKELGVEDATVIVFGGSYAGNMAAWSRLKYPHLIQGALASSAPVYAKADFYEYYDVVTRSLQRYDEQCVVDVKNAFDAVEELLAADGGPEKLKKYFNLCNVTDVKSPSDVAHLMNTMAEKFASAVQYNRVENGKSRIAIVCDNMTATYLGSPLQRLARLMSMPGGNCLDTNYEKFVSNFRNVSWEVKGVTREWFYQTCTEYGYYQTTNSKISIFGTLFPLDFFVKLCVDLYGDYYNGDYLESRIRRTNLLYGGSAPDLSNVIFTNGDVDPWHALSVLEDLNESTKAILIKGSSHCRDLYSDLPTDPPDLIRARKVIREAISKWITS
ncbi:hypothetical protein KPH14_003976 [Odynerus spinipes]|uniref:Serine protease K12H4.7 n=1 Tax=Odynerus spinipes TaxID=1348599 RepID=A0AAD9RY04_9HYME|nr:hypothetical protein KPH14_003976 [Odynerus spinipes]